MGGLHFLNGMFLGAAAVAVVPIIIHLVQRRRVQRVVFGSVRFLRSMSQRVVRRRRFTELLLIVLRTVALAALALAFARPFFWQRTERAGEKAITGESAALLVIDNSYSMIAEKRLEKAKEIATEFLKDLDPDVKVGVAKFSSQFQVICPIGGSLSRARDAVDGIKQSWEGTDLFLAMEQAEARLLSRLEQKRHIVLISDFQKSSWRFAASGSEEEEEAGPLGEMRKKDKRGSSLDWKLKPGIELTVKDVAEIDPKVREKKEARAKEQLAKAKKEADQARKQAAEARKKAAEARRKAEQDKGNQAKQKQARQAQDQADRAGRKVQESARKLQAAEKGLREASKRKGKEFPNVFIEKVAVPRLVLAGGLPQVISAKIVNRTGKPVNDAQVVLRMAGKEVGRDAVNIRPHSEAFVRFRHTFKKAGDTAGSVAIKIEKQRNLGDELPDDNVAYFCIPVTPRVNVLIVNGDPNPKLNRNDAFFVQKALVPGTEDTPSPFQVREVLPAALKPADLKGVDAVIFTDADSVPASNLPALKQFVASGGGVAFFCGSKTRPAEFNQSFAGLAPGKLLKLAAKDTSSPVAISYVDFKHEIFQEFRGQRRGDFARAYFIQYYLVQAPQSAKRLARFNNWHPVLLEQKMGKGKSLLFVSSVDLEWNNLCIKSIFPPFIHELARRLCGERAAGGVRNLVVGERLAHRLPGAADKVELRRPDGKKSKLDPVTVGEGEKAEKIVAFTPEKPGIYEVAYAGGPGRFAANIEPGEPDSTRLDVDVLITTVRPDPTAKQKKLGAGAILPKATVRERAEGQQKLWMYVLGLVLVVLAVEMVIAAKAGTA